MSSRRTNSWVPGSRATVHPTCSSRPTVRERRTISQQPRELVANIFPVADEQNDDSAALSIDFIFDTPTIEIVGFSATHLSGASALVQSYGLCQAAPFLNILVEEPLYDVLSAVQVRIVH